MRALVLGDLHLDRWRRVGRDPIGPIASRLRHLDLLILAGDSHNHADGGWADVISELSRHMDPERVRFVPGNHDYYGEVLGGDDRLRDLARAAGADLAQKDVILLGDVRILCCTLWTDFGIRGTPDADMRIAAETLSDYDWIRSPRGGLIRPADTVEIFRDHAAWLDAEMSLPWEGRTVVVTHHAPSARVMADERNAAAFGSDLDAMIRKRSPDVWLSAHTHRHLRSAVGGTALRNVSLGYPNEVAPVLQHHVLSAGFLDTDRPGLLD